jgi:hypothetical protein
VSDPAQLETIAGGALHSGQITTTTLGLGLGYDEVLLSAISRGGDGSAHFAEEPHSAAAAIASLVAGATAPPTPFCTARWRRPPPSIPAAIYRETWSRRRASPPGYSTATFIQGPPGSGKTYTGAQLILSLLHAGHRVGVTANSHKAIHNLLH